MLRRIEQIATHPLTQAAWLGTVTIIATAAIILFTVQRSHDQAAFNSAARESCLRIKHLGPPTVNFYNQVQARLQLNALTQNDITYYKATTPAICP
jgi:Trk-type K+ transport system membrane component